MSKVDPLGDVSLHWLITHSKELCTCLAKRDPSMLHAEDCNMSKEYAALVRKCKPNETPAFLSLELNSFHFSIAQHVIKCALCGIERMAKDLDVIYQAVLNKRSEPSSLTYPANAVKAVCPEHNRKGTVSIQRVRA